MCEFGDTLLRCLLATSLVKLLFEASFLRHLRARQNTLAKRSAVLLTGELARATVARFVAGALGGLLIPALLLVNSTPSPAPSWSGLSIGIAATVSFLALLVGELLERYLFFTAVVAPRMPGALRTCMNGLAVVGSQPRAGSGWFKVQCCRRKTCVSRKDSTPAALNEPPAPLQHGRWSLTGRRCASNNVRAVQCLPVALGAPLQ
jgi:hypothetical protein